MEETAIEQKLAELIEVLRRLPESGDSGPLFLARRNKAMHPRPVRAAGSVQDSMDYLRLSIKYLVFDLEATRRENAYLRRLVNETD